MQARAIDCFFC